MHTSARTAGETTRTRGSTETIADPDDARLADYSDLRHTADRRAVIVEGVTALEQIPGSRFVLRSVLCLERHERRVRSIVGDDAVVLVASSEVIRTTVGFNLHRGVVAAVERPPDLDPSTLLAPARTIAVLECLNDLENLGAVFRNARAFGVDAVLLDTETADPLNRRSVRVSVGHVLHVPFARCTSWPPDLPGFTVVALTPRGELEIDSLDVQGPIAVLLGSEGAGLSEAALGSAHLRVRIPMSDAVDSLNVATAAAIAFHQLRLLQPERPP